MSLPDRPAQLLTRAALDRTPAGLVRPTYDLQALRPGIVHVGVSAFHRAHQAVYLDRLAAEHPGLGWSVTGVGLRGASCRAELLAQDLLWTVVERGTGAPEDPRVIGVMRDYLAAREDPRAVAASLVDPRTSVVSLTVTAPAYAGPGAPDDVFHLIARALEARRRAGAEPFTVLSCDNLPRNGAAARERVVEAAASVAPGLAAWVERSVGFPNSMVDRITPPATVADQQWLRRRTGVHDRAMVVTEPFTQWVLEDAFCSDRPAWEEVGVQMVSDVAPYARLKTRVLNAAHLVLGYLGRSAACATTDRAMADPQLRALLTELLRDEVVPLLGPVPGTSHAAYLRVVLDRLGNPAMADPLARLRRRGSVRVANYLLPSLEDAVRRGRRHVLMTDVVVSWITHLAEVCQAVESGEVGYAEAMEELADPAAQRLMPLAAAAQHDVRPFLAAAPGFGELRHHPSFVALLQQRLTHREELTSATAS